MIAAARERVLGVLAGLLEIPSEALESEDHTWELQGRPMAIRHGFYHLEEILAESVAAIGAALDADGHRAGASGRIGAQSSPALWDLRGLLIALAPDAERDPGGGEWSILQTMKHVAAGHRWFASTIADSARLAAGSQPIPDSLGRDIQKRWGEQGRPSEGDTLHELEARLQEHSDLLLSSLPSLEAAGRLHAPMYWMPEIRLSVGYFAYRASAHLQEHTIQVDKTAELLGRPLTEQERIMRLVARAYGRVEGVVFGVPERLLRQDPGRAFQAAVDRLDAQAAVLSSSAGARRSAS